MQAAISSAARDEEIATQVKLSKKKKHAVEQFQQNC